MWHRGIKFSETAYYPNGRPTRSAVTLVACDLPATHHIASMAGIGSYFYYSVYNCYHKSTYRRVNFENWEPRDRAKTTRIYRAVKEHNYIL